MRDHSRETNLHVCIYHMPCPLCNQMFLHHSCKHSVRWPVKSSTLYISTSHEISQEIYVLLAAKFIEFVRNSSGVVWKCGQILTFMISIFIVRCKYSRILTNSRGRYLRNFWVGICCWDPGTFSLYQS